MCLNVFFFLIKLKRSSTEIAKVHQTISVSNQFEKIAANQKDISKENEELKVSLKALQNDYDLVKKSELWYKDQFHECQSLKYHLQNQLLKSEKSIAQLSNQCNDKNHFEHESLKADYLTLQNDLYEKLDLINKLNCENKLLFSRLDEINNQTSKLFQLKFHFFFF